MLLEPLGAHLHVHQIKEFSTATVFRRVHQGIEQKWTLAFCQPSGSQHWDALDLNKQKCVFPFFTSSLLARFSTTTTKYPFCPCCGPLLFSPAISGSKNRLGDCLLPFLWSPRIHFDALNRPEHRQLFLDMHFINQRKQWN